MTGSPARRRWALVLAAALVCTLSAPSAASAADATTSYQGDATHAGYVDGPAPRPPLKRAWVRELGNRPTFPLVVGDRVFVSVIDEHTRGSMLYALDRGTGETLWSRALGGRGADLAYDRGTLFHVTHTGMAQALDPATGAARWTRIIDNVFEPGVPVAAGGKLYMVTSFYGNYLEALDGDDGSFAFSRNTGGVESTPAVDDQRVYLSDSCDGNAAFDRTTGERAWANDWRCSGAEGRANVVHDGRVYTSTGQIRDAATGTSLGTYSSHQPPAFAGNVGLFMEGNTLVARDALTLVELWRHQGDGHLVSAPLIVGQTAYVASFPGRLDALDLLTGRLLEHHDLGGKFATGWRDDATSIAAGGGTLVVPVHRRVVAYTGLAAPEGPTATKPVPPPLDPPRDGGDEDDARAFQQDSAHTGHLAQDTPAPPLRRRWQAQLEDASYSLVADGKVFTVSEEGTVDDDTLHAFDQATGEELWRARIPGQTWDEDGSAAYDAGRVFVAGGGRLRAFDAATGDTLWVARGMNAATAPVARDGVVYVAGDSQLFAVSGADGRVLWERWTGDGGTAATDGETVWTSLLCNGFFGIEIDTLRTIRRVTPCSGGGTEPAPVITDGRVELHDDWAGTGTVLETSDGEEVDGFVSMTPPAHARGLRITLNRQMLQATPVDGGALRWSFQGDGHLALAPIVVGDTVFTASSTGRVYGLSLETGRRVWSTHLGVPIEPTNRSQGTAPPGLAAGEGVLVVPTREGVVVLEPSPDPAAPEDGTAPQTTIAPPPPVHRVRDPMIGLSSTEDGSAFECMSSRDLFWRPCSDGHRLLNLPDGETVVRARATDPAGNVDPTPAEATLVIDAPPAARISGGPDEGDRYGASSATFTVGAGDAGSTTDCRLDGGEWSPCPKTVTYSGLAEGEHLAEVRATDPAGQVSATPAQRRWIVDTVDPVKPVITAPAGTTADDTPRFAGTAGTAEGDTPYVEIHVYRGSTVDWSAHEDRYFSDVEPDGSWSFDADRLRNGTYTAVADHDDSAGNWVVGDPVTFTVDAPADATPPVTEITDGPDPLSNESSPSFSFRSEPWGTTFECRLDERAWEACDGSHTATGLTDGVHAFAVRAINEQGVRDPTPAEWAWHRDTRAPQPTLTAPANGSTVDDPTPTLSGAAGGDPGDDEIVTVEIDDAGPALKVRRNGTSWSVEAPPLADGSYYASVSQDDEAGNSRYASVRFTVAAGHVHAAEGVETTMTGKPPAAMRAPEALFRWTSNVPGATFRCRVDDRPWSTCDAEHEFIGLAEGGHVAEVRAVAPDGREDPEPARHAWRVDSTAPELTLDTPGAGTVADPTPRVAGRAGTAEGDDPRIGVNAYDADDRLVRHAEVVARDGTWEAELGALADGAYRIVAYQRDSLENSVRVATRITVAATPGAPPDTTLGDGGPAGGTTVNSRAAAFTFSGADAAGFECRLDGWRWQACSSPHDLNGLGDGEHVFEVRAVDAAGREDPEPASRRWKVDATAPAPAIRHPADGSQTDDRTPRVFGSATTATGDLRAVTVLVLDDAGAELRRHDAEVHEGRWTVNVQPELPPGEHTLRVLQRDAAGNEGAGRDARVRIVPPPPPLETQVTERPPELTSSRDARIAWTSPREGARFECRENGEWWWTACTSPYVRTGLNEATHSLEIRAFDPVRGGEEATPEKVTWRVDPRPPQLSISDPYGDAIRTDATPSIGGYAYEKHTVTLVVRDEAGAEARRLTTEVARNGEWAVEVTPALAPGRYRAVASQVDEAGNRGESNERAIEIVTVPDTRITEAPPAVTRESEYRFAFEAVGRAWRLECRVDDGSWSFCTSPVTRTAGHGPHTFEVRAVAPDGVRDETPARHEWRIDYVPPAVTLERPAAGAVIEDPTPRAGGRAGVEPGDAATVTLVVRRSADDVEVRRISAPVTDAGTWSTDVEPALPDGQYRLRAYQRDEAGNEGGSGSWHDVVVRRPPPEPKPDPPGTDPPGEDDDPDPPETVLESAPVRTSNRTITFNFFWLGAPEATFQCRTDGSAWAPCGPPHEVTVDVGEHVFEVRAVGEGGPDATPAVHAWTVHERPPAQETRPADEPPPPPDGTPGTPPVTPSFTPPPPPGQAGPPAPGPSPFAWAAVVDRPASAADVLARAATAAGAHGLTRGMLVFRAGRAGRLVVQVRLAGGRRTLLASATRRFSAPGDAALALRGTPALRRLVRARRASRVAVLVRFVPAGGKPEVARRAARLAAAR